MLRQFFMFAGVGMIGTAAHFATLALLVETVQLDPVASSVFGFVVGALVNYHLNRRMTFRSDASHIEAMPKFLAVAVAGCGLNALLMLAGVNLLQLHYLVAQAFATVLVLFWNFAGSRHWAFRQAR